MDTRSRRPGLKLRSSSPDDVKPKRKLALPQVEVKRSPRTPIPSVKAKLLAESAKTNKSTPTVKPKSATVTAKAVISSPRQLPKTSALGQKAVAATPSQVVKTSTVGTKAVATPANPKAKPTTLSTAPSPKASAATLSPKAMQSQASTKPKLSPVSPKTLPSQIAKVLTVKPQKNVSAPSPKRRKLEDETTQLVEKQGVELLEPVIAVISEKDNDEPSKSLTEIHNMTEEVVQVGKLDIADEVSSKSVTKKLATSKESSSRGVNNATKIQKKEVGKTAVRTVEPGEIIDIDSTLEPGEIMYNEETGEVTGIEDGDESPDTSLHSSPEVIHKTGPVSKLKKPLTKKSPTNQNNAESEEQIIFMRSDDGKMVEVHGGDSNVAFNALVQLASEAVEAQDPQSDSPVTRQWVVTRATKNEAAQEEEEGEIDYTEDDGEKGESGKEAVKGEILDYDEMYEDNGLENSSELQSVDEDLDEDEDMLHRVAMKFINRNRNATTKELIQEFDELGGEVEPVTDLELHSQERSNRSGRYRPVKQIVMSKELQEMMDKISNKDNFEDHVVVEWDDSGLSGRRKMLKCKYCDKILLHKHDFRKHIKTHSEVDYKPFTCPICGYKAQIKAQIVRHVNIHSEVKPYMCTECGKCFNFKQKLQLHMKYHMDIRDQLCPLCPLGFHEQKTLKNHLIKIHSIPDIKDFMHRWSQKKFHAKNPRVDMSDYKGLPQGRADIVQVVKYGGGQSTVASADAATINKDDVLTEVLLAAGVEGANQVMVVQTEKGTEEQQDVEEAVTQASLKAEMETGEADNSDESNEEQEVQQILVAQDGSVSIAIPTNSYISQMGIDDDDDPMTEELQNRKRSTVYGCRKTKLQTHRFKMGLVNAAKGKAKETEAQAAKSNKLRPKTMFHGAKRKRFVNNQRIIREEQVEKNLLNYCTVENPSQGDKDNEQPKVKFNCLLCEEYGVNFPSKSQFVEHLEETHREVKAWKCHLCSYSCRLRTTLAVHLKVHTGIKEHSCHLCGRRFYFKQKLNAHLRHHANIRPHKCSKCSKAFTEKNDLTKHFRRLHEQNAPSTCEICSKEFKDRAQLKRHLSSHDGEKSFLCTICQKYYRSKMSLNQHMKSHTCMFHCEICDRNFGSYSGFMAHKVMHDESYEGYVCELCNAVLHTKGSLNRHKKVAHSDDRPFVCKVCGKGFKAKKDVKNHEIVHINTKQFICSMCTFSCKRMESLRVHMRRHSEVKPYQCGVCGKEYTQKFSLETHLKRHTGHVEGSCSICKKTFLTKYQMEQHMKRKHGKDKDKAGQEESMTVFMCEECNAVFLTQDTLAVHILAEHMKQGFVGGPPLGVVSNNVKMEDGQNSEAPEPESVVEVVAEGQSSNGMDQEPNSGQYRMETVERLVSICDPNEGQRYVTLLEPVQQESILMDAIASDLDTHSLKTAATETLVTTTDIEQSEAEDAFSAIKVESSYGEGSYTTIPEHAEETLVTIKDPNTNEEYTVAMSSDTIGNLLTVPETGGEITQDIHGNTQCVVVAETVEIPVGQD